MSRSIRLGWVETIVFSTLIVFFQQVESATLIFKRNPSLQSDEQLAVATKNSQNTATPPPTSDTTTHTIFTIEPPTIPSGGIIELPCITPNGQFPSTSGCDKYVNCWNGIAIEQTCPTGLLFNPSKLYCDYKDNVDCKGKIAEDQTRNKDCPVEFGTFRNRSDCTQYYTCAYYRVAARFHCPSGFSFSDILGICDYSSRVDCSKEPQIFYRIQLKDVQDSLLSSNAFAHPDLIQPTEIGDSRCFSPYGFSRDSTNCSIYYDCEAGTVRATHVCPTGYSFSTRLNRCEWGDNVDCSPYKLLLSQIANDVLRQVQNCQPGNSFRLNPQCTTACRCQTNVAEIIQCATGLAYDSKTDRCLPNNVARC